MLKRWQFWVLTMLAVAQAALVGFNINAFGDNRKLQLEVNQRAVYLQQTAQAEQMARDIALSLAQLAVRNQDTQIRQMLASLGITVNFNEDAARAAQAGAAAAEGKRK